MTNDSKYAVAKKFTNKGRAKVLEFKGNLKDILHFHKHKLHTILFDDKLHPAVRRQHAKDLDDEKVAAADKAARMKEFIKACNKDATAILMIDIADTTVRNRLPVAAGDDMSFLRKKLRQLREQIAAMTTTNKSVMRITMSAKLCDKCNVPHRSECYSQAIATGKLNIEQAAEKFSFISDPARRRPAAAAAALKRYQDHQAHKGGGNPKPDKLERMCATTKVVTCYNVDLRHAISLGFSQDDRHVVLHMDSKCEQHMLNDMRRFPFGMTPEPNVAVKIAEKGVPPIVTRGKGNAILVAAGGAVIKFTNALLVPDLDVNLASVEQAMVQNKVAVCFGDHLDMLFHNHNKSIPHDAG